MVVGFGDSNLSSPNSDLFVNLLARAWLIFDYDDSLAGLGTDLGSLGPKVKPLLPIYFLLNSYLSKLEVIRSNRDLPFSHVSFRARTWLVFNNNDFASLSTPGNSASKNILLSDELLSLDLNSDSLDLSLLNLSRYSFFV